MKRDVPLFGWSKSGRQHSNVDLTLAEHWKLFVHTTRLPSSILESFPVLSVEGEGEDGF